MSEIPTTVKNRELVGKRREQITLAAIKLFSQKGFHGTSLRDLSEASGLSYGNIYDYVGSKEDIFSLIHDYLADLVMKALLASIENIIDPIEKLRRIVRAEFNVMDQWADAIMLLYQESHILTSSSLHKLLSKERAHVELIEEVVGEAIEAGLLRECNRRVAANMIKCMVDAWVIKRWDLRGFANRLEVENTIIEIVLNGLMAESGSTGPDGVNRPPQAVESLQGYTVLVANSGTPLGTALCHALITKGARLAIYSESVETSRENPIVCDETSEGIRFYSSADYGSLDAALFKRIQKDMGVLDVYIHEMGAGYLGAGGALKDKIGEKLKANLEAAEEIARLWDDETAGDLPGRVLYIAPWNWDAYADQLKFELVRGSARVLTENLTHKMAGQIGTVNCLFPGYLSTTRPSVLEKQYKEELQARFPGFSVGELSDATEMALFLASDSAKYVTGQIIHINGGVAYRRKERF